MYLVTGGAGFIGSNIVKALNDRGVTDVIVVDDLTGGSSNSPAGNGENFRNLCDLRVADYFDRHEFRKALLHGEFTGRISAISHQGACTDTMENDGRYMLDNNFTFSKELLHFALEHGVPMVYASSAAVYGNRTRFTEVPENEQPINVYGYSKLIFDQYVRRVIDDAKRTLVGLRYFNVYGPREKHKGRMASMPYQLHGQLTQSGVARLFEGCDGYGPGEHKRDFVFVGDVVDVNLTLLDCDESVRGVFNLGSGACRSFNDVANGLIDQLGSGRIEYIPFPQSLAGKYQSFTEADLTNLRKAGYTAPMTSLEDGLAQSASAWREESPDASAPAAVS